MGLHRYTGTAPIMPFGPWRGMAPPGHCRRCGQSSATCCCGCRECRKEAKELLVTPDTATGTGVTTVPPYSQMSVLRSLKINRVQGAQQEVGEPAVYSGTAFIGGGCCVTLAVEYAPIYPIVPFGVQVDVVSSDNTELTWARGEPAGTGYCVHECVITTKPGATLTLTVANCTGRVRWCEVFSC